MSRSSKLGAVLYNTEATWAETAGVTFGTRLQTVGPIDVSKLQQQKFLPDRLIQLVNEITPGVNGVKGGEFDTEFKITGHGSTTAGAITLNALETLLGIVFGAVAAARVAGGSTATVGGTATALNTAAVNGFFDGALLRCGTINDTHGNGQFATVSSHAASVINLLTAIDAAMANAEVIWCPAVVNTIEDPTASNAITGTRWRFITANMQYECRGCYPKSISITGLNPGEEPTVRITWGVSVWKEVAVTMPDATAVQTFTHAPVAAGSFVFAALGATTRLKRDIRSFTINIELGIVPLMGPGGLDANQSCIGAARTPSKITFEFVEDAQSATAAPDLRTKWTANSPFWALLTWSAVDSTAGALFLPYTVPDGDAPTQIDTDGLNRVRWKGRAGADNTKSTDLARSAFRMALG